MNAATTQESNMELLLIAIVATGCALFVALIVYLIGQLNTDEDA